MTKEEIVNYLERQFSEKVVASGNYLDMTEKLEDKNPKHARGFYEMAVDEHDHAEFIYCCMEDYSVQPGAELMAKWKALEERFR